jgi:AMP-binding enzyme C-terminal domain/AMP-binding enzyme
MWEMFAIDRWVPRGASQGWGEVNQCRSDKADFERLRPTPTQAAAGALASASVAGRHSEATTMPGWPLVMAGYYKNAAASEEAARYGWHHTGDIGYLDADNYLFIVDRAKDMIITGGFNVYSAEVEQVLLAHPAVQDCAVIGLPDDKWGERVTAIVQPRPGRTVTEENVRAFVKARLGSVKTPKQVEVWADLPRSARCSRPRSNRNYGGRPAAIKPNDSGCVTSEWHGSPSEVGSVTTDADVNTGAATACGGEK